MVTSFSAAQKEEWKNKILQQKNSNQSITQWCLDNNIHPRRFYYWRSKLFPDCVDRSSFTELSNNRNTGITIECREISIHLEKSFDYETLKECLSILRSIK